MFISPKANINLLTPWKLSKYFWKSVVSFYLAKRVNRMKFIAHKLHLHDTGIKLKRKNSGKLLETFFWVSFTEKAAWLIFYHSNGRSWLDLLNPISVFMSCTQTYKHKPNLQYSCKNLCALKVREMSLLSFIIPLSKYLRFTQTSFHD